jgi:MoaA/NifB/PqqE/SkfB family radical SAM enzyme
MPEAAWRALLKDLKRTRYRGELAFHNYNEPLADPKLLTRLAEARAAIPNAKLMIFTNGDLLTPELFKELVELGVGEIRVTLYPSDGREDDEPTLAQVDRRIQRLGLEELGEASDVGRFVQRELFVGGLKLVVRAARVARFGSRAGALGDSEWAWDGKRYWPCLQPTGSAAIDSHGNLKICCHVYDTLDPKNASTVMGNVGKTPFSKLWAGRRMQKVRKQLGRADFDGLPVCAGCDNIWIPPSLPNRALKDWPEEIVALVR